MAEQTKQTERAVSVIITIVIDSVPNSEVQALEEEAFKVGDEWGARVTVNKGAPLGAPQG